MQWGLDGARAWRASLRRISIYMAVLGMHLGMGIVLLGDVTPSWRDWRQKMAAPKAMLQLEFIAVSTRQTQVAAKASVARPRKTTTMNKRTLAGNRPPLLTRATPVAIIQPVLSATTSRTAAPGYIPGGNLLRGGMQLRPSTPRLPSSAAAIVPGIHMIDPRTQGVGGAVRILQSLFGVPDRHCVDVDTWRTLSTQELLARHLSPQQVESTAEQYGCGAGKSS